MSPGSGTPEPRSPCTCDPRQIPPLRDDARPPSSTASSAVLNQRPGVFSQFNGCICKCWHSPPRMTTHFVGLAPRQPGTVSRRVDGPCCGPTWLRWIRPGPGAHHSNIGGGEVITHAQHGVPGSLGELVCEAVTGIQPGWMTPFAISPPAAHCPGCQVCVNRHDVDLRITEEPVDNILPGRPEPGLDDDAQLDADSGWHQPGDGVLQVGRELVAPRFAEDDRYGCRGVDDKAPARRLRQRGRPASS